MESSSPSDIKPGLFGNLRADLPAGFVVFLVALPLCLGVALASGAPLFSGIIAGMVGGLVIGFLSGSPLGVSGPAAGLTVIVLTAIDELGGFDRLLLAVALSGVIQVVLGYLRTGVIGYYFPSAVIKGMLSAIGIIIILKEIPHAVGYDTTFDDENMAFVDMEGDTTFSTLIDMFGNLSAGAILVSVLSLGILVLWEQDFIKRRSWSRIIPGSLVVVALGIAMNAFFQQSAPSLYIGGKNLVNLPVATSLAELGGLLTFPDFSQVGNGLVWRVAFTLAIVGSLETLLSAEAIDKLDPYRRVTPLNRELKAQGVGNLLSGLIGGLPVTQVIVRSSANVQSGGLTKMATMFHGLLLLVTVLAIPRILNLIPLPSLAAILILIGYKLAKPSFFRSAYRQGWSQFIPFVATIVAIVFTDLLTGIVIGLIVAAINLLLAQYRTLIVDYKQKEDGTLIIKLAEVASFLHKASLQHMGEILPAGSQVVIDASDTKRLDADVLEVLEDIRINAASRNIDLDVIGLPTGRHRNNFKDFEAFLERLESGKAGSGSDRPGD